MKDSADNDARKAALDQAAHMYAERHMTSVSYAREVLAGPVPKPPAEKPARLSYWPYCEKCKTTFQFNPDEPFAYCGCGETEWGNQRPADYVANPVELAKERDLYKARFEALAEAVRGIRRAVDADKK